MSTEVLTRSQLLTGIDEAVSELSGLMSALDENKVNIIPYKNSWTAAQLLDHVIKSTRGMAQLVLMQANPADRDPNERVVQLQKIFLDFSSKLDAPGFIIPGTGPFEKNNSIAELETSFAQLKQHAADADLNEIVDIQPLGPITKSEILHFVLYHTQRHLHQMHKICDALRLS